MIKNTISTVLRECGNLKNNPIYFICMVVLPVVAILFFTSLMDEGQPSRMPIGVVDLDNTATTRSMVRRLNTFQNSSVVAYYNSVDEARHAIQENKIYAFLYFPKGTTDKLLSSRQPKISLYYSYASLTAGSLLFKDLKTIASLGSAAVGQATMRAKGYTDRQIVTFLQPIALDLHSTTNPWTNYNIYLSTMLVPGTLLLFIFLLTAYSFGTEIKFGRGRKWLKTAGNNIWVAMIGKLIPQTVVFLTIIYLYSFYVYGVLDFPHNGGIWNILLLGFLAVVAAQGFGAFMFGLMPQMRMSMSICSLWGVLSFSMVGTAFPVFAMDAPLEALAQLFPLRHYWRIYQTCVFNDFPLSYVWINILVLVVFALLPVLVAGNMRKAVLNFKYTE